MDLPVRSPNLLLGCDFSCSPSRRKPIVLATGTSCQDQVVLFDLEKLNSLESFEDWLRLERDWVGVFDFPFGLPRELVEKLGWPMQWLELVNHYASLTRIDIRDTFASFCNTRAVGKKFAHRGTDKSSGSSPSMKWVNPPVAFMLHAGIPRLLAADVHLPGLHLGDCRRVGLEGYPGMLARTVLGRRSYKSDNKSNQNVQRLIARKDLISAMEKGQIGLGLSLKVTHLQRGVLINDASGDSLDAVACLIQAAWAVKQGPPDYGMPPSRDGLEGWIVTA